MNLPLISIITVVRNDELHIEATMRSVLEQTYKNIEYILIDGASTDSTLNKIYETREHYPKRNIIVVSEPDKGIYDAMNKGMAMSHGKWINFMNCGDTFYTNTVLEVMCFSQVEQEDVVLYGNAMLHFWDGPILEIPKPFFEARFRFKGKGICHQAMFFPGDVSRTMQYDLKYRICADYEFSDRLWRQKHPYKYVPITVCDFSWGGGMSTNTLNPMPLYWENGKIARQTKNPIFWIYILRKRWQLWRKLSKMKRHNHE